MFNTYSIHTLLVYFNIFLNKLIKLWSFYYLYYINSNVLWLLNIQNFIEEITKIFYEIRGTVHIANKFVIKNLIIK